MDYILTVKVVFSIFSTKEPTREFVHFIKYLLAGFPPLKMYLRLSGTVKEKQSSKDGFYYLANDNLNGFPYWKQDNGDNAIWFHKSWYVGWTVGNEDYLGQDYNGIIGPDDVTTWPSQTLSDYKYWHDSEWKNVEEDSISFEDCKC